MWRGVYIMKNYNISQEKKEKNGNERQSMIMIILYSLRIHGTVSVDHVDITAVLFAHLKFLK